jgi:PqqD family protein of HPr-rel-A system
MMLVSAGRRLLWQEWDDHYLVFQASSAETHVFNETTALILRFLEEGPRSVAEVKAWTEVALDAAPGELGADEFDFATRRLEELGLIEYLDETVTTQ